jgi:serine/threonine-protein kinase
VNDGAEIIVAERDPLIGSTVGPYVVGALIGEGGMGRVYRVHHARLVHRQYALKVLLGDVAATPAMRMRFAREAESASKLSHPNVVGVCDFGVTGNGLAYLAMDLVVGRPLSDLITNIPMPPARVIKLARQLCAGLAYAHDRGLVHRDFKPDNVIVVSGDVPRIADFGLAISLEDEDVLRLTGTDQVLGTPAYVAPEQCTRGEVDGRTDLYALGVTMFEMLTGGFLPFDGDVPEVVGLKVSSDPPRMSDVASRVTVPTALETIVRTLIARKPADRYADARAVDATLAHAERHPEDVERVRVVSMDFSDTELAPVHRHAARGPLQTQIVRTPRRHRSFAMFCAAATIVGIAAGVLMLETAQTRKQNTTIVTAPAPPSVSAPPVSSPPQTAEPPAAVEVPTKPTVAATYQPARSKRVPHKARKVERATRHEVPRVVEPESIPIPTPAPIPIPTPVPPASEPVRSHGGAIENVDVRGALPAAVVRRAVDRVAGTINRCRSTQLGAIAVQFTIGESRRPSGTHAQGTDQLACRCIVAALAALRTEEAPDVGDVTVRIRVGYRK